MESISPQEDKKNNSEQDLKDLEFAKEDAVKTDKDKKLVMNREELREYINNLPDGVLVTVELPE